MCPSNAFGPNVVRAKPVPGIAGYSSSVLSLAITV